MESNREIRVRFTANGKNVNLYHVTKLTIYLPFTVPYCYTEISRFTPVLSLKIVLRCFCLLVLYFENS